MSTYRRYSKYIVPLALILSMGANIYFAIQLRGLKQKVTSSNTVTSVKLESAIRDTMYSIRELQKEDDKDTINNLQLSVQQLLLIFNNWVDLNQSKESPKESLQKGLNSIESLRNTIVYHLGNQYKNNERLTHYDTVLLDKVYERLDRLLVIYNNIEKEEKVKNDDSNTISGLGQWSEKTDEVCRLYRHSRIPNEHLNYIDSNTALTGVDETLLNISNFKGDKKIKEAVQVKDGVHYYEIFYYSSDKLSYSVWIDAVDGSLRFFEDYTEINDNKVIFKNEALDIAKKFMGNFKLHGEYTEGISIITDEDSKNTTYAFQFVPIVEDTMINSDTINISISSKNGNIVKYSNNFSNTEIPSIKPVLTLKQIEEIHEDLLANAEYIGLSVVRSFYTNYNSVITYKYNTKIKENITQLYFDSVTGNKVHESYSMYEPIGYITEEDQY